MGKLTAYKIYRRICLELGIMFPLKEQEMSVPINKHINTLEYQLKIPRSIDKEKKIYINNEKEEKAIAYYKICRNIGSDTVDELSQNKETFKLRASEYPDRAVNLHTVISVLYLSGYRGDELVLKSTNYLIRSENK